MLPGDALSSEPVLGQFIGAAALGGTRVTDYADGPVAIQDVSQGLRAKVWTARVISSQVVELSAPGVAPIVIVREPNITDVSVGFDQNGYLTIVWVANNVTKFRWFDSSAGQTVTSEFTGWLTPKIALDDYRIANAATSDVVLTYIRNGNLYYRQQRDRYGVERLLAEGNFLQIETFGMTDKQRLQWRLRG